jgi:hypothetical protein
VPTKAELELAIEDLKNEILDLQEQKANEVEYVKVVERKLKNTDILLRGLTLWNATNSPGSPLCIAEGPGEGEANFSLTIYAEEGNLNGVVIGDLDGRIVAAAGLIPAEVMLEELKLTPA